MRSVFTVVALLLSAAAIPAQVPRDTVERLEPVMRTYSRLAHAAGETIWPGFRPHSIPVLLVMPGRGSLLFNWSGEMPPGFAAVEFAPGVAWRDDVASGAASTAILLGGRPVAQVVIGSLDAAEIVPSAFHEAFHTFQAAARKEGQRFGRGENSFHVSSYPVFDVANETLFALEGLLLATALDERRTETIQESARQFVAVRRQRHQRLATEFAEFDRASEMNEGLAQYAQLRALVLLSSDTGSPPAWRDAAARKLDSASVQLREVTEDATRSFRLRYYRTGAAIALLLDRLSPDWKATFIAENLWLEDAVARASGLDAAQLAAARDAAVRFDSARLGAEAGANVAALQARRRAQVDSVLSAPGVLLVVRADSLPSRDFNSCGFDPQNHLQVTTHIRLQTRWWRPCSGGPTYAEFNVPSVHDSERGTLAAVIGAGAELELSAGGNRVELPRDGETLRDLRAVKLIAPRASVEAIRADVVRDGRTLTIWAKPAAPADP